MRFSLDRTDFDRCLDGPVNGETATAVRNSVQLADRIGIRATPTFLIGVLRPDGSVRVRAAIAASGPYSDFERAVERVLHETQR